MYLHQLVKSLKTISPSFLMLEPNEQHGIVFGRKTDFSDIVIRKCLVSVDPSMDCIEAAVEKHCKLIVCHHALYPKGFFDVNELVYHKIGLLTNNNIWVYCLGSSWIGAEEGLSQSICQALDLEISTVFQVVAHDNTDVPVGRLCKGIEGMDFKDLLTLVRESLNAKGVRYNGALENEAGKILVVAGFFQDPSWVGPLLNGGVNTIIAGEVGYAMRSMLRDLGIKSIEIGHHDGDILGMSKLRMLLSLKHPNVKFELHDQERDAVF